MAVCPFCETEAQRLDDIVLVMTDEPISAVPFAPHRGEINAVTGSGGSGKSTLLHDLAGLQPPHDGRVLFGEIDV